MCTSLNSKPTKLWQDSKPSLNECYRLMLCCSDHLLNLSVHNLKFQEFQNEEHLMYAHFPEYFLLLQPLINNCKCKLNCGKSPNYSTESPDSKAKFYLQMRGVECTQDLVSLLEGSQQEKLFRSFNWGPTKEANR
jgi:hypothetical protein